VRAVERALAARHQVTLVNADLDAFAMLRSQRGEIDLVFNLAEDCTAPVVKGSSRRCSTCLRSLIPAATR